MGEQRGVRSADLRSVSTGAPPKVLVIDDDQAVCRLIRDVLEMEGFEVTVAADGYAGLRAIDADRPDCVVLDVMMPGLDGHAVLTRIRSLSGRHLPVVMLTAHAKDGQEGQEGPEGVNYFRSKPFEPEELLRFLDCLFEPGSSPKAAPLAG